MHKHDQQCTDLIKVTANALSRGVVALMLIAVQRGNLELSIAKAVEWLAPSYDEITMKMCSPHYRTRDILQRDGRTKSVVRACVAAFPSIWVSWTTYHELTLYQKTWTQYYVSLYFPTHTLCANFYYYVLAAFGHPLCILTCRSLCALQSVSAPPRQLSSRVLTNTSLCHLQSVSVRRSMCLFPCPDKFLPLPSSVCECASLSRLLSVS